MKYIGTKKFYLSGGENMQVWPKQRDHNQFWNTLTPAQHKALNVLDDSKQKKKKGKK